MLLAQGSGSIATVFHYMHSKTSTCYQFVCPHFFQHVDQQWQSKRKQSEKIAHKHCLYYNAELVLHTQDQGIVLT